jgi:hypothetical protein
MHPAHGVPVSSTCTNWPAGTSPRRGQSQVGQLRSDHRPMLLRGLAHLPVQGGREAENAIKMAKRAGSQGKGGT